MRLLYSKASPFARKVRACAVALGVDRQIHLVEVDIAEMPTALTDANPLGRVPTLITEDGFAIFDSPVICDYLNGSTDVLPIIPASGAPRWLCRRLEALGDGLMDAAVERRQLLASGLSPDHPVIDRRGRAIGRTLDRLEREKLTLHVDVGNISIACALGYLDLRFADDNWRTTRPRLAEWHEAMCRHECLSATAPEIA